MEAPKKDKDEQASPPPPPLPFAPTICKVAVAQICQSVGYARADSSALRSLSDVAALYLRSLALSASSIANSRSRTDSNLLDLVRAIEDLHLPQGFAGASDPTKPLLRSAVLKDMIAFVRSVDEIPFPRPIHREKTTGRPKGSPSFAQLGRGSPVPHVPRWLPCFPESWQIEVREDQLGLGKTSDSGGGLAGRRKNTVSVSFAGAGAHPLGLAEGGMIRRELEEEEELPAERKIAIGCRESWVSEVREDPLGLGKRFDSSGDVGRRRKDRVSARDPPCLLEGGGRVREEEKEDLPGERKRVKFRLVLGEKGGQRR